MTRLLRWASVVWGVIAVMGAAVGFAACWAVDALQLEVERREGAG